MKTVRKIFCCGCQADVDARLVTGAVTYPHRRDLAKLPFWKCDGCGNFVGCHHKTSERTRPLGVIPTQELKAARQEIHRIIDPIWKSGRVPRAKLYGMIAHVIGVKEYHTADIRSIDEANNVLRVVKELQVAA